MKLNKKDKPIFWITIIFGIVTIIIALFAILIGHNDSSKETDTILDSIEKNCGNKTSFCQNETYYISEDELLGGCAYLKTDIENTFSLKEGVFFIRIKLSDKIHTENSYEWKEGTLGLGGEELLNQDKRFIADFINEDNKSFLELYIDKNDIVKARFIDNVQREFILSSNKINSSNWNNIFLIWGENNKIDLIINNNLESSVQFNKMDFDYYPKEIYFGSNINKRYCLNGYIDEIRVYNKMPEPTF